MKAYSQYTVKNLLSYVYIHEIILAIVKVSNHILYKIFDRYIKQQLNKYHNKNNNQDYFKNKIIYIIPNLGVGGAERQLINDSIINSVNKYGYARLEDVVVSWFDKNLYQITN